MSFKNTLINEISKLSEKYNICGFVSQSGHVYPLGADTKVLSSLFELVTRPAIYSLAAKIKMIVVEPEVQNHYPDFTLVDKKNINSKIAIDVKTTYRNDNNDKFNFTLGGYTSFIKLGNERKNIVFPFYEYSEHWIIGFVYNRINKKKSADNKIYSIENIDRIQLPFDNVETFVQEKWRIAGDKAGSGNTTNIGSINGYIKDFKNGKGPFKSEKEFLEYWRGYKRTANERTVYTNIDEFRNLKKS